MKLKRLLELAGMDAKTNKVLLEQEGKPTPSFKSQNNGTVLFPKWVVAHIKSQHSNVGKGSFFSGNINIQDIAKAISTIKINRDQGLYNIKVNNAGFDLVKSMSDAEKYPDAQRGTTKKQEGKNEVEVPTISTSLPLGKFKTNIVTLVIRAANPDFMEPADKEAYAEPLKNNTLFSILSAWPGASHIGGKEIPPASKWNGEYAVIIPKK